MRTGRHNAPLGLPQASRSAAIGVCRDCGKRRQDRLLDLPGARPFATTPGGSAARRGPTDQRIVATGRIPENTIGRCSGFCRLIGVMRVVGPQSPLLGIVAPTPDDLAPTLPARARMEPVRESPIWTQPWKRSATPDDHRPPLVLSRRWRSPAWSRFLHARPSAPLWWIARPRRASARRRIGDGVSPSLPMTGARNIRRPRALGRPQAADHGGRQRRAARGRRPRRPPACRRRGP
jgi:hypothetical protein